MIDANSKEVTLVDRAPRIIGIFALFVWAHGIFDLWPLPPRSDLLPLDLQWSIWRQSLGFILVGLTASALAYRAIRFWWIAILVTSGTILLINVPPLVSNIIDSPSFSQWLDVWFTVFGRWTDQGKTVEVAWSVYNFFVYPSYHVVLVTGTVIYLISLLRQQRRVPPTAA